MKTSNKFVKIKKAIRLFFILTVLIAFGSGIFLENSNIYAQIQSDAVKYSKQFLFDYIELPQRGYAPKTVTVKTATDQFTVLVYSDKAGDILQEAKIKLDSDDEILPSADEYIPHFGKITIIKVDSYIHSEVVSIPFNKIEVDDNSMNKGTRKVTEEGNNGLQENTIRTIFKDNKVFRKEVIGSKIIVKPVDRVIKVGTKPTTVHSCSYWNNVVNEVAPKEKNKEKNTWMKYVMLCESGCDSGKGFDKYFEGSKAFYGLYQFTEYTFKAYGGKDMFDGFDQIEVVSRMYDMSGNPAHHWPACNKAFERDYNK